MTLNGYSYRIVSGYLTIRDIRILFNGIWIYLDHPHQLSVSTRWQNGHYPVNPDCAGANRIHALGVTSHRIVACSQGADRAKLERCQSAGDVLSVAQCRPSHLTLIPLSPPSYWFGIGHGIHVYVYRDTHVIVGP